ncbi:MAG: 30S ribosomal protein S20 [Candidatus Omnitrophica bacterium]|nr:30S ribosomal protein S20 [Candidatus Omnitrophota bacterium]
MAHRRASIKKIRVDVRRREQRLSVISELKTAIRKVRDLIVEKKADDAKKASRLLFSKLDKAVKKGILPKNRASRRKSRLQLKLNSL